jgi:hypothetical protein
MKQRAVQRFWQENVPPVDIRQQMEVVYGQECVVIDTVRRWAACARHAKLEKVALNMSDKQRGVGSLNVGSIVKHWKSWKQDLESLSSHEVASPSIQRSTALKYKNSCRDLTPRFTRFGSPTMQHQLSAIWFSFRSHTERTPQRPPPCGGRWRTDSGWIVVPP